MGQVFYGSAKRFSYESDDQLRRSLAGFATAYTFGRRLKILKGLTPCGFGEYGQEQTQALRDIVRNSTGNIPTSNGNYQKTHHRH